MENNENQDIKVESESALDNEIDLLKSELAGLEDRLLRAIAESQNIRKIAEKEKSDALRYGISGFAKDVLSIRDNLKLALSNCGDASGSIVDGIKLTLSEMDKILANNGVKLIEALDCKFDPHFHQAVVEIEDSEKDGVILQVLQDGFLIQDRLLRPALVAVAKKK